MVLTENVASAGAISAANDVDCFAIAVPPGRIVRSELMNLPVLVPPDLDFRVFDTNGGQIQFVTTVNNPETSALIGPTAPEAWTFLVEGYEGATGDYELTVWFEEDIPDEAAFAMPITPGTTASSIQIAGDVDYFVFELPANVIIDLSLTPLPFLAEPDLDMRLYDQAGALLSTASTTNVPEVITWAGGAGTYYVSVDGYMGATGDYELTLAFVPD